jgi:hypothetical protein
MVNPSNSTPSPSSDEEGRQASTPAVANFGRTLWGFVFIASGVVNALVTLPNPQFYWDFAKLTFFPFYRDLIVDLVIPNARVVTILVVIYELIAGTLVLDRGQAARWGLVATGVWVLFVCPTMGWYTIWSPLLLVIPLLLLRFHYPRSVADLLLGLSDGA